MSFIDANVFWKNQLQANLAAVNHSQLENVSGRVVKVTGLVMEAVGLKLPVGSACVIHLPSGVHIEAEVVGFDGDRLFLMPQNDVDGVVPGAAGAIRESNSLADSATGVSPGFCFPESHC